MFIIITHNSPNTLCSTRHCRCPSSGVCPNRDAIGVYGDPDSRTAPTCLFRKYPANNSPKTVKIAPTATPPTTPPAIAPAFGPDPAVTSAVTSAVTTAVAVAVVGPCTTAVAGPFRPVSRTSPSRAVVSPAEVKTTVAMRDLGSEVQ